MTTQIVVPDLGESIVEATVAEWLKQEGDRVEIGEPVLVLETDKVDLDVSAEKAGVLARIVVGQGEDVRVGDVLGEIDESAEASGAGRESAPADESPARGDEPRAEADASPAEVGEAAPESQLDAAIATPVARRLADEHGLDIDRITPSGPRGRITKEDVERHLAESEAAPKRTPDAQPSRAEPAPAPGEGESRSEERRRLSRRRRTIARRLVEAQQTAAMLTTFNEVDMTAIMALRKRRQEAFVERYGVKLGIASFFVKAAVGALKAFPEVNAELQDDTLVIKHYYDIGMAIGAPEGLVVPVLRDADRLSFATIEKRIKDFAERATEGSLTLDELQGGTFTITNGGVFGSLLSTPILNPPQVGILGLHKIEERPIARDGEVVIRPMMYVALSYDHRVIDGREAVQFLVRVKQLIEDPDAMLLEG